MVYDINFVYLKILNLEIFTIQNIKTISRTDYKNTKTFNSSREDTN